MKGNLKQSRRQSYDNYYRYELILAVKRAGMIKMNVDSRRFTNESLMV